MPRFTPAAVLTAPVAVVFAVMIGLLTGLSGSAAGEERVVAGWEWPVEGFRIAAPYVQPAHAYGAGHRGIDLDPGSHVAVHAPADGTIAFCGRIADRGIVTIDHAGGLVTTLEPVECTTAVGARVEGGDTVGVLSTGGHATPGTLHFGVRLDGEYINPLVLLGGVPRAVLLPCCG